MKALFIIILLSVLSACGGSSSSSPATLDVTLGEGVRGLEAEPAITDVTAKHEDTVVINSRLLGDIDSEANVDFNYTPAQDTLVALVLTGTAQDLDISVSGTALTKFSLGDNSNESIVFNAVANQDYIISMVSWLDGGSYELKIVEGNRASLGLSTDEYYVELILVGSETCNGETFEAQGYVDSIFNFAQGYVTDTNGLDKVEFDRASGNTLIKDISYNEDGEEGQGETRFTISPEAGLVTGSGVGGYRTSFSGETVSCSYSNTFTGEILL
ncbi:MAG: hypothetical protein V7785_05635 [Bermanella sp.]